MSPWVELVSLRPLFGCRGRGLLKAGSLSMKCALGRGGLTRCKREGDGATPIGSFALRQLYFRPDRVPRPETGLPVRPIDPGLAWSDDPADPLYNRAIRLPRGTSHELMWRHDCLYDYVVVVGYNDRPALRPLGSAIFLHLARSGYPATEGCIAVAPGDMRRLLARLGPRTRLVVRTD